MNQNILLVDSSPLADALIDRLEQDGYSCVKARGPLRVRKLFASYNIVLVLWREEQGNNALSHDIIAEFARHGHIPVLHLYPEANCLEAGPAFAQRVTSIPTHSSTQDIVLSVKKMFEPNQDRNSLENKTELAFRNVVEHLWCRPVNQTHDNSSRNHPAIHATGTSVNVTERERLSNPLKKTGDDSKGLNWLAKRLLRKI